MRNRPNKPTDQFLDKLTSTYNCDTINGIITHKIKGNIVGRKNGNGYIDVSIRISSDNDIGHEWRKMSAHHIVWYFHNGIWPDNQIDHIDGQRDNNKISNLRLATQSENNMNTSSRGGYKGVSWDKSSKSWTVVIHKDYVQHWIGRFDSEEEAALAYNIKAKELYGEFAKLNDVDCYPKSFEEISLLIDKYGTKDILFAIKLLNIDCRIRKTLSKVY